MTNLKNEIVESQVESVEGEYLNARDYAFLRMKQMREQADDLQQQHEERLTRYKESARYTQARVLASIFTKTM
ncbi:hypothetical protein [Acinetobacter calcoaceticus]|uniref:hypothetical protein n=1 Tax=Acinetobacter calcoaceticus TaxID=471 RepID=UPI0002CE620B|nr:hypothetical protein [Acinetobacter calcoaceticus]ENU07739.1 hypothetical protein F997_03602 [Acinetobacter calcoaceticus NIPH 13]